MTTAALSVIVGSGYGYEYSVSLQHANSTTKFIPVTDSADEGHRNNSRHLTPFPDITMPNTSITLHMDDKTTVATSSPNHDIPNSSVFEKNPKETTFELLDLTLTLPSYNDRSQSALDFHRETPTSDTIRPANEVAFMENASLGSFDTMQAPSLPKYRQKFGTFPRGTEFFEMEQRSQFQGDRQKASHDFANESTCSKKSLTIARKNYHDDKEEVLLSTLNC